MSNDITLPSVLIEKMLWNLPTEEIVRTSVLSKEWRYFWTKIPKVVFREDLFDDDSTDENLEEQPWKRRKKSRRCKLFNAMYNFLLLHQGPILDFTLSMRVTEPCDTSIYCVEIDQILLHLSLKNTVKKLHLTSTCDLPLSIFSFHQLTDLHLFGCSFKKSPTTFNGYGSLTTLYLKYVDIYRKTLVHILSHNPLLKSFTLLTGCDGDIHITNNEDEFEDATIIDLFKYLPVIEHFAFCVSDIRCFGGGALPQALAAPLVHLKSLCLERMCFLEQDWLCFLVLMIRSSPNLEKLKLEMSCEDTGHWNYFAEDDFYPVTMQDYSDIRLEHLIELEMESFGSNKLNLDFVKLILAKSPVLKTVRLMVYSKDEELKILRSLVSSPRASPMVEIVGVSEGGKECN
uniref:F-box/FBD/LRR-repeat protein At1g13570-like n=1 Tax=Erigeron canadensis TaxID=72917 RepID=UPI001CB8A801|nr:F-box/FBD/LRR-repeat protein At1g13570-like [Erigeron canadensis]XP_043636743.1 F-box/FBD/LRR-repeat protein At1g13570-like [Erigeron canadensis]